jgi:hypothetical protein
MVIYMNILGGLEMGFTEELRHWNYEQRCQEAVKGLEKNRFTAVYCANKTEAIDYIIQEADQAKTVGFGGSRTVVDLGISDQLKAMGKELLDHNQPGLTLEERLKVMRQQLTSDLFLASANAVTLCGKIISIDGNGNRVASMIFGPQKVILVVGRNKLVSGVDEGIKRIKTYAAPLAAKRLNIEVPCAKTGFCIDCNSASRICAITVILERKPRLSDFRVLIVNEEMGF